MRDSSRRRHAPDPLDVGVCRAVEIVAYGLALDARRVGLLWLLPSAHHVGDRSANANMTGLGSGWGEGRERVGRGWEEGKKRVRSGWGEGERVGRGGAGGKRR